jgi:hypothetical protein
MGKETPKATGDSDDCCWWPAVFSGIGHRAGTQSTNPQRSCQRWGLSCLTDVWVPVAAVAIQRCDRGRFPRPLSLLVTARTASEALRWPRCQSA